MRFSQAFTVIGLVVLALHFLPIPLFDENSVTVIAPSIRAQVATAKAFSIAIGKPAVQLNTKDVSRYIFKDGTSVDFIICSPQPTFIYNVVALKQVTLGLFSRKSPTDVAEEIENSLKNDGYAVQIVTRPDSDIPDGDVVLVLSNAFRYDDGSGYGIIIRKHTLRIGGPNPIPFTSWSR
ncbi:MAG: hypothetical protein HYR95_01225 [Candidatus Colwellbacteria bacterium]|nr:hypothetical protein [Candidatus Colwellbacteria bacterium]